MTPDDEVGDEILAAWQAKDPNAFRMLFRAYRALVYGVLRNLLGRDSELEDVVQTSFLEVFRSLDSFEGRSKLSSWVARVALHTGYHHLRRCKSRPSDYCTEPVGDYRDERALADPDGYVDGREVAARVRELLALLPPKKRDVFILNDLQGLPQEEVAEIVGASIATVRTRLFYARKDFWKRAERDAVLADFATTHRPSAAVGDG